MSSGLLDLSITPIENLFDQILRTRLQRRAKSILVSGLEFLITDLAILFLAIDLNIQNKQVELGLFIVTGIGALYVLSLCVFLFVHASCYLNAKKMNTTAEIEEAFAKKQMQFPLLMVFLSWYFLQNSVVMSGTFLTLCGVFVLPSFYRVLFSTRLPSMKISHRPQLQFYRHQHCCSIRSLLILASIGS